MIVFRESSEKFEKLFDESFKVIYLLEKNAVTASLLAKYLMRKANFNFTYAIVVQIGKIMSNLKYEYVKKGSNHNYLLRFVDAEVVERDSNSLDDAEAQKKEQENNNQIIRLEEDLLHTSGEDGLPF